MDSHFTIKVWEDTIPKCDKISKNGPNKICGRQSLKNLEGYGLFKGQPFKFFKGCLPQILLGPFLNTLSWMVFLKDTIKSSNDFKIKQQNCMK